MTASAHTPDPAKPTLLLGAAFVLQFVTSMTAGLLAGEGPLAKAMSITDTMQRLAAHSQAIQWSILLDYVTSFGVIWLGAMLYLHLRHTSRTISLTALGLYAGEAIVFAASRSGSWALLRVSQAYTIKPDAASEQIAQSLLWFKDATYTSAMILFGLGAILFYTTMLRARLVPVWLSAWGLITVTPVLVNSLLAVFGTELPVAAMIPYVPFEITVGIYLIVNSLRETGGAPRSP